MTSCLAILLLLCTTLNVAGASSPTKSNAFDSTVTASLLSAAIQQAASKTSHHQLLSAKKADAIAEKLLADAQSLTDEHLDLLGARAGYRTTDESGLNTDHFVLHDGRAQSASHRVTKLNDHNDDYMIEFSKDIVPKGTFPPQQQQSNRSTSRSGLLGTLVEEKFDVKIDPSITASGFFKVTSDAGVFRATANFKLTANIAEGWKVTFESEFAAEATACDKAFMTARVKSDVVLELGSNKPMCFTSAYNTFRGGSTTFLPGGGGEKFTNLAQCIFDFSRSSSEIEAICAKPDNSAGTQTCTCTKGTVTKRCAAPLDAESLSCKLAGVVRLSGCPDITGSDLTPDSTCGDSSICVGACTPCANGGFTYPSGSHECGVAYGGFCNRFKVPIEDKTYEFDMEKEAAKLELKTSDLLLESKVEKAKALGGMLQSTGTDVVWSINPASVKTSYTGIQFAINMQIKVLKIADAGYTWPGTKDEFPPQVVKDALDLIKVGEKKMFPVYEDNRNLVNLIESLGLTLPAALKKTAKDSTHGRTVTLGSMDGGICSVATPAFKLKLTGSAPPAPAAVATALAKALNSRMTGSNYKNLASSNAKLPDCTKEVSPTKTICPFKDVEVTKVGDVYEVSGKTKAMSGMAGGGINSMIADYVKGTSALLAAPTLKVDDADYEVQDTSADITTCTAEEKTAAAGGTGCGPTPGKYVAPGSALMGNLANVSCGKNCSCWENVTALSNASNITMNVSSADQKLIDECNGGGPADSTGLIMGVIIGVVVVGVGIVAALYYFKPNWFRQKAAPKVEAQVDTKK